MGALGIRLAGVAAVVGLATVALFGFAAPAPASTSAEAEMLGVRGLDSVTYGQTVAYTARITNTGNVTLKEVTFRNPIPETIADGEPQQAVFQHASCEGALTETEFSCLVIDKLPAGESLAVTIAWKTPTTGTSSDCPEEGPACMTNSAFWETGPFGPHIFGMGPVVTTFLASNDEASAATYALAACTDPSTPTLATDQAVGPGNPLATSICAPSLPVNNPLNPGLVTSIEELAKSPSDPGTAPEASDICIPAPGFDCDQTPFVFSPLATFTFVLDNASVTGRITKVFHNGVLIPKSKRADPRVASIKIQKFKGITTIVVLSSTNGRWTFG